MWEYRVATYVTEYNNKKKRYFIIIECCYNDKGKPEYHTNKDTIHLITNHGINGLKDISRNIQKAFNKPILDLDNFPKEYAEN